MLFVLEVYLVKRNVSNLHRCEQWLFLTVLKRILCKVICLFVFYVLWFWLCLRRLLFWRFWADTFEFSEYWCLTRERIAISAEWLKVRKLPPMSCSFGCLLCDQSRLMRQRTIAEAICPSNIWWDVFVYPTHRVTAVDERVAVDGKTGSLVLVVDRKVRKPRSLFRRAKVWRNKLRVQLINYSGRPS